MRFTERQSSRLWKGRGGNGYREQPDGGGEPVQKTDVCSRAGVPFGHELRPGRRSEDSQHLSDALNMAQMRLSIQPAPNGKENYGDDAAADAHGDGVGDELPVQRDLGQGDKR